MSDLMVSVSGIRGIVGDSLTPEEISKFVASFSSLMGEGTIVVGRDARPSGEAISQLVCSVLNLCGRDVIDIGIATTPTVAMAIKLYTATGGIAITASHNPAEWNALKFMGSDTMFLDEETGNKLIDVYNSNSYKYERFDNIGKTTFNEEEAKSYHIKNVLDIRFIDKSALRKRNFKVAIDCINGAGSVILPELLQDLGCDVIKINSEPTGEFVHGAEPIPENLVDICTVVREGNFDLGMVVDPDSDRLALIDENGNPLGEEYTLALVTDFILSKDKSDIAVNVSTSMVIDDIAKKYECNVLRTKVGEVNVSKVLIESKCIIGGEGNGGIIMPEIHPGRDAVLGAALVLQYIFEKDMLISYLKESLPQYVIIKDKVSVKDINFDDVVAKITEMADGTIDTTDGLKIIGDKWWVQLRKSNTEPIVRIFAEASDEDAARVIIDKYKAIIK